MYVRILPALNAIQQLWHKASTLHAACTTTPAMKAAVAFRTGQELCTGKAVRIRTGRIQVVRSIVCKKVGGFQNTFAAPELHF